MFSRPILFLPPIDIELIECKQSESERDFYETLFERSKVSFVPRLLICAQFRIKVCFNFIFFHEVSKFVNSSCSQTSFYLETN